MHTVPQKRVFSGAIFEGAGRDRALLSARRKSIYKIVAGRWLSPTGLRFTVVLLFLVRTNNHHSWPARPEMKSVTLKPENARFII